jgi:hypothetical protein
VIRQAVCSGSRKWRPIIWLSLAGLGIAMVAAFLCVWVIRWSMDTMADISELDRAVEAFLDDLGKGRINEAYSRTTTRFQNDRSLMAFRNFVEQFPALETPLSGPYGRAVNTGFTMGSSNASVTFHARNSKGASSFTLLLTKEDDHWKVDHFSGN